MDAASVAALNRRHTFFTWQTQTGLQPPVMVGAERCHLVLDDGRRVLDLVSGAYNAIAGLNHPRIAAAIGRQAHALPVAPPGVATAIRGETAAALAQVLPPGLDRVLFTLGGSDAVEQALKLARLATGRERVVARRMAYHGATLGALALTGDDRRDRFEPWLMPVERLDEPYCFRCPWRLRPESCERPCADQFEALLAQLGPESVAALVVEPIQGTSGGFIPPSEWLLRARALCDRHGIVLIADEVFTGFGRTGRWFGCEHAGVIPDMIALGKGLTSGHAPLGAVAVHQRIAAKLQDQPLVTGSTCSAQPVALAAARATLEVLHDERLVERAGWLESILQRRLAALCTRHELIGDLRVIGAYAVLELVRDRHSLQPLAPQRAGSPGASPLLALRQRLWRDGVTVGTRWNLVVIAPPLCVEEADLLEGLELLDRALGELAAGGAAAHSMV